MREETVKIAWFGKHFGEEPPLVGKKDQGAGGIFFSGCHLHCVFCQNWQISQEGKGKEYSLEELVNIMLDLQKQGAVNIDLVTPVIWSRQIKKAVLEARERGLIIPIVWNTNAYESVGMLRDMEGIVDIYLPDFKYGIEEIGYRYSGVKNYPEIAEKAIREMLKQAGPLVTKKGIAHKGIIVRHMVLPNNLENSFRALEILAKIDNSMHIGLMSQYFPLYHADQYTEINRPITFEEWKKVTDYMEDLGFENGWTQELDSSSVYIPDFNKENPFTP